MICLILILVALIYANAPLWSIILCWTMIILQLIGFLASIIDN